MSAFFLSAYSDAPLEIQKKSRIYFKINVVLIIVLLIAGVLINCVIGRNYRSAALEIAMSFLLVTTMEVLRSGRYTWAANATFLILLCGLSVAGFFGYSGDPLLDQALFGFNLLPVMFYTCLVGTRRYQPLGATALCLVASTVYFISMGRDLGWQLETSHEALLVNSTLLIVVAGFMAHYVLSTNNALLSLAEADARSIRDKTVEIQKAEERLRVTLRSIGDAVITTDVEGRIGLMNRAAEEMTGWSSSEAIGKPLPEVFHIVDESSRERCDNPVDKVLAAGVIVSVTDHTVLVARDGRERIITDSGAPIRDAQSRIIGVVLVFRDETERRRMLQNLRNTDRLEALGVLAGGIAHDFNNLLNGMFGFVDLAHIYAGDEGKTRKLLDEALSVFDRARNLTQQLLTFSKGGAPVRRTTDLAPLIRKSVEFALSGSNATVTFDVPDNLWCSDVDEHQLEQVIDNIAINARQAMPRGGRVTLRARNLPSAAAVPLVLEPGKYVKITIADEGRGIPKSQVSRIFDPFFTTKEEGSGLGLATSYTIIKKHSGHIEVETEEGRGTTFHIYLPAADRSAADECATSLEQLEARGHILVVDDEDTNLDVAQGLLESLGFQVTVARDQDECLEAYRSALEAGTAIDLVILDQTIRGGPGGEQILGKLVEIDPNVTAVATSGYANSPVMSDPAAFGFAGGLHKPYRRAELARLLSDIFEKNETPELGRVPAGGATTSLRR